MRAVLAILVIAGIALIISFTTLLPEDDADTPKALIYSTPSCTCCTNYAAYLQSKGFAVELRLVDVTYLAELMSLASPSLWSCHVTIINGYYFIGHVPASVIYEVLEKKPAIDGISLPGMPSGSPGMPGELLTPLVIYYFKGNKYDIYIIINSLD